eukprot:TRINITY_DN1690_c0_g1_i10.p1 TRINITY_DN1690_c0_g1~~TRINITY_DN1690_c0_g1_i10.p1  ORF type:complete len:226 (-),score=30.19 TRINITY_DN1690_c0_g1_i10:82-759(-)
MNCCKADYATILGRNALKGASLVKNTDADVIDFLVTPKKQPNYIHYCDDVVLPEDVVSVICKYTEHQTQLYAKVNLALAADSPVLSEYGEYIKQLRSSVLSQPLMDDSLLYRGVDMSRTEIEEMEKLKNFFIPSFTSTSLDRDKAYNKSALLVINTPFCCKNACSITSQLSRYYSTEREVLIACYSAFTLERVEKIGSTHIITLYLDEHMSVLDTLVQDPNNFVC